MPPGGQVQKRTRTSLILNPKAKTMKTFLHFKQTFLNVAILFTGIASGVMTQAQSLPVLAEGLKFAKDIHDVFGLKDNKNEGKELWETPGKDIWLRRKWEYKFICSL